MISTTLCDSVVCCGSRVTLPRTTDHYNGVEWADMFVDYVAHHMKRLGLVKGGETAYAPREYEIAVHIMQAKFSEIESMLEYWASASLSWSAPLTPRTLIPNKASYCLPYSSPLELHFGLFQQYRSGFIFRSPGSDSINGVLLLVLASAVWIAKQKSSEPAYSKLEHGAARLWSSCSIGHLLLCEWCSRAVLPPSLRLLSHCKDVHRLSISHRVAGASA